MTGCCSRRSTTRCPLTCWPRSPSTCCAAGWPGRQDHDSARGDRVTTMTAPIADLVRRRDAEDEFAAELATLAAVDDRPRPPGWNLSPNAVVTYLLGGPAVDGTPISPKYVGPRRLVEVAVATLATDRALLLLGVPGTAKTWVSEHLSAA